MTLIYPITRDIWHSEGAMNIKLRVYMRQTMLKVAGEF